MHGDKYSFTSQGPAINETIPRTPEARLTGFLFMANCLGKLTTSNANCYYKFILSSADEKLTTLVSICVACTQ